LLLRLQLVQVIDGALRVRGGSEDRAVVILECLQPVGDIFLAAGWLSASLLDSQ